MEAKAKRLEKPKYLAISAAALLVTAFVLAQPTFQQANAVGIEGLPGYDNCQLLVLNNQPEDPISMNTVRSGNIVKTIHAEKEIFSCFLDQGNLPVIVDVTTYIEIYENIVDREVIETNAVATTCLKDQSTAAVIDCESYDIPTSPVFVGSNCEEAGSGFITHPQEMNTVTKGKLAKTVEAQKEVFACELPLFCENPSEPETCLEVVKKVDIVLFTTIFEDLSTQTVIDVQFYSMRCVVLFTDQSDDLRDATVETCQFSTIEN